MLGRSLDRGIFVKLVGSSWLRYVEIVGDSQEANNHEAAATVGAVALRDNWQQQIYTLQDQNKVLQGQVDSLAKQVKELQAQIGTQTDDTKLLNGFGEILTKLIIRLGLKGEQK